MTIAKNWTVAKCAEVGRLYTCDCWLPWVEGKWAKSRLRLSRQASWYLAKPQGATLMAGATFMACHTHRRNNDASMHFLRFYGELLAENVHINWWPKFCIFHFGIFSSFIHSAIENCHKMRKYQLRRKFLWIPTEEMFAKCWMERQKCRPTILFDVDQTS